MLMQYRANPPRRTRISFVIRKIADRSGGAERVLIELANEMAARGHHVEILSYEPRRIAAFYPLRFGVSHMNLRQPTSQRRLLRRMLDHVRGFAVNRLRNIAPLGWLRWINENAGFVAALRRHYSANPPDVIVAWMPPAYAPVVAANDVARARLVASTHNEPSQDYTNPDRWDPSPYDRRHRLEAVCRMDHILVLLDEYRSWYPQAVRSKVRVMPNAVRVVDPARVAAADRQKTILAVGRLASVKRHHVLIRAWGELSREFPDWRIRIFGQGPDRPELERLIAELRLGGSVMLMGHTAEIEREYLEASVLCHPAEFEGFPLAVTEALACGLPVVGFADCSGLNRLVEHDVNGRLISPSQDRVADLVQALRTLLADPAALRRLGAAAPGSVAQYSPGVIYDAWEGLLAPAGTGTAISTGVEGEIERHVIHAAAAPSTD